MCKCIEIVVHSACSHYPHVVKATQIGPDKITLHCNRIYACRQLKIMKNNKVRPYYESYTGVPACFKYFFITIEKLQFWTGLVPIKFDQKNTTVDFKLFSVSSLLSSFRLLLFTFPVSILLSFSPPASLLPASDIFFYFLKLAILEKTSTAARHRHASPANLKVTL